MVNYRIFMSANIVKKDVFSKSFIVILMLHSPLQSEFPVATGHGVTLHYFVSRVGQVVAFYGGLYVVLANVELLVEFQVDGVPVAEHVLTIVGYQCEAIAGV